MSEVLAVTADPRLRELLADAASRAGLHLPCYASAVQAHRAWTDAQLLVLGVDAANAAHRYRRPRRRGVTIVVSAGHRVDRSLLAVADAVAASSVVALPTGRDHLVARLRRHGRASLDRLRAAGYTIGYADRSTATQFDAVWRQDWRDRQDGAYPHVFVDLSAVARGACTAGQSTTVQRSNYRALRRAFPDVFTDLVYSNGRGLGAFAADLPPNVVDVLCRLAQQHLVFDEDELSTVWEDEMVDSWRQWVAADVAAMLGPRARAVWDALDQDTQDLLWWQTVEGTEAMPEHDLRRIRWPLDRLVPAFAHRLLAEQRRLRAAVRRDRGPE
ncbi:hypothetical protein [Dactylosporangium sp. NPDC000521]|uniref:hypothetical protein n=1 Tax=Dactylosporangium sp. NPDC000521 TaxID=3363975 RepID=UPI0036B2875C